MKKTVWVPAIVFGAAIGVWAATALPGANRPTVQEDSGTNGHRFVHAHPVDAIQAADSVVLAKFIGEFDASTGIISPVDGLEHASRTDRVRSFDVIEALSGDLIPGSAVTAFITVANIVPGPDGKALIRNYEHPAVKTGETYVLFLKRQDPAQNPAAWAFWGEPEVAQLGLGGELTFLLTDGYLAELRGQGVAGGRSGAGPAFDISLGELRGLIAQEIR